MINWIPDFNRHGLPTPPEWFLKILWDQDAGLVLVPSRQTRSYVLGRRREFSRAITQIQERSRPVVKATGPNFSDADMLAQYGLVKVDAISGNVQAGSWVRSCPALMQELRRRDMWAAGGADKYVAQLEAEEQKERDATRARMVDDIDHRSRDAYRSYKARTGQRTIAGAGISRQSRAKIVPVGTL